MNGESIVVATYPSTGRRGEIEGASSHEENVWSRHQRLFGGNVRKTKRTKVCKF